MSPATTQIPPLTVKDCAQQLVRANFLITRQLREYLTPMMGLARGDADRPELE